MCAVVHYADYLMVNGLFLLDGMNYIAWVLTSTDKMNFSHVLLKSYTNKQKNKTKYILTID